MEGIPMIPVAIAAIIAIVIVIIAMSYVKASPNEIILVSGLRKTPKIIKGGAGFRIPFLQKSDRLTLELMNLDVKTKQSVPTKDYIDVTVDAVVTAKISDDERMVQEAAQNFLNVSSEDIKRKIVDILEGNMREIVGAMALTDLVSDRKQVSKLVLDNAAPDLAKLGVIIQTFNIQNFVDGQGVIENLGADKTSAIRKAAAISKANAERDISIANSQAKKEANDAFVKSEMEIAQKKNELAIKQSELKKEQDVKKAEADNAYKIEAANQQKAVNIMEAEAETARQEKLIEVREKEVSVRVKELEAEKIKTAEAEREAAIIKANADKEVISIAAEANYLKIQRNSEAALFANEKSAEAEKIKIQKDAEARRYQQEQQAEADKFKTEQQAEADKIQLQKKAEAEKFQQEQQAEAQRFQQEQIAEAQKVQISKNAEAQRFQQEQMAEGTKAMAEANLVAAKAEAEGIAAKGDAEGSAIKATGNAEAETIKAKGLAEAEAKDKMADAMAKFGDAAKQDMAFQTIKELYRVLPDVAGNIAKPLASVKEIKMYGEGNGAKLTGDITKTMTQILDGVKDATGLDGTVMLSSLIGNKLADLGKDK